MIARIAAGSRGATASAKSAAFKRPISCSVLILPPNTRAAESVRPSEPARGWLDGLETTSGAAMIQDLAYLRDALGLLVSATNPDDPDLNQSFAYDTVGNLTYNSRLGT